MTEPELRGPYGGPIERHAARSLERISPSLRACLGAPRRVPATASAECAATVPVGPEEAGALSAPIELHRSPPWSPRNGSRASALRVLARVARSLAALHAEGFTHGDLRPEMIREDPDGSTRLLTLAHESLPGALLRARLRDGADPREVAFAAAEALDARALDPASDVFALASLTFAALAGRLALGQVHLRPFAANPEGALAQLVEAGLSEHPQVRPTALDFARALDAAAASMERDPAMVYREPYEPAPSLARPPEVSPGLMLVLVVGGLCAFIGAVLLVSAGWGVVGELGRVAMLGAMSLAALGVGQLAASRGLSTGAAVARALAALFGVVTLGYSFYLLNDLGRLGLLGGLCVLTFAAGSLASSRSAPLAGATLQALGSQLVWAVGAQAIAMAHPHPRAGAVSALAAAVSAVTWVVARGRRSGIIAFIGALDLAAFFIAFGVWLDRGTAMGLAMYTLSAAGVYALLGRVSVRGDDERVGAPYASFAVIFAGLSALAGLWVMTERWPSHGIHGAAWPYLVALAAALASRLRSPVGPRARFAAVACVALTPTIEALARDELAFLVIAIALGFATLFAATRLDALRRDGEARTELLFAALLGVLGATSFRVYEAIEVVGRQGDPSHLSAWLALAVGAVGLVATSYAATGRVLRAQHRTIEVIGLGVPLSLATLRVLAETRDLHPPLITLTVAAIAVALGALSRRAALLMVGACALVVNVWIQYFVRLADVLPTSVRLVGFGVGLLLGGVLYEQTLRHRVAAMGEWD